MGIFNKKRREEKEQSKSKKETKMKKTTNTHSSRVMSKLKENESSVENLKAWELGLNHLLKNGVAFSDNEQEEQTAMLELLQELITKLGV